MIEKKHRIEDALEAVRSAQEKGILPGGGLALLQSRDFSVECANEDQEIGCKIIKSCLEAPVRQMAENSGRSGDIICDMILKDPDRRGYDFKNDQMTDMLSNGILDPAKVTCTALKNAVSVASTLITTNFAIIEK